MQKRFISFFLTLVFLITITPAAYAAGGSLDNFKEVNTYAQGQFSDVATGAWYAENVASAYELGLMKGSSTTAFSPDGNVTVAEAVTMAARLHSIYTTGTESFVQSSPWYQDYVDYATENGIIADGQFSSYTAAASRLQFAAIFAAALPDEALSAINTVESGVIPDTNSSSVYKLYRAGILTGSDSTGAFKPDSTITRAEASTIVARMADETLRKVITLKASGKTELTAEQVYAQCAPAVFYIEVYDKNDDAFASGSGFFISDDGIAVTNYHVIESAYSAYILTSDTNEVYEVLGVLNYNVDEDWAVLKIDGSGFDYLDIGDASAVVGGATVYAIGNPLGLQNTISQGLISNPARDLDGVAYIQTSAAISNGSSGGALINKYGEVIGITSASFVDGQNLNLAVPIEKVAVTGTAKYISFSTVASKILIANPQEVSMSWGDQATINITQNTKSGNVYLKFTTDQPSIVSWTTEDWDDDGKTIPLTIYALAEGTAHILIRIYYSGSDELVASTTVTVTVSLGDVYYENFYPVPDYGAYAGVQAFYEYYNRSESAYTYYYKASDLTTDYDETLDGYKKLLKLCDFAYYFDYVSDQDETIEVYSHNYYNARVYFGREYYNNIKCVFVKIKWN
ncbi:MAG: trypsin-like peptidase domain-containing protein [Oscillospiraceae bacterium]